MKKLLLGLFITLAGVKANAQQHMFIQATIAQMENKQRNIFDIGSAIGKHGRIALYTENFLTDRHLNEEQKTTANMPNINYRKYFLGARYSYVISLCDFIDVVPSAGVDIRLNGENTVETKNDGVYGQTSNMPSIRAGVSLEKALSYNTKSVFSHLKLAVNNYAQINCKDNFGKKYRPGAGASVVVIF